MQIGPTIADPVTGQLRTFADLQRRNDDLKGLLCPAPATARTAGPVATVEQGITRFH